MFDRKARMKEYHKKWYKKNRKKVLKRVRKWAKNNKDKRKIITDNWTKNNKDKIKVSQSEWAKKNRKQINKRSLIYIKNRYKTDPSFKLRVCLRSRILSVLKGRIKSAPTLKLLDIPNIEFVWKHLEKTFKPGMTRENHAAVWHVDHILPCSSFDLSDPNQQKQCFHYTNLQALFVHENLTKSDKIL